MKILDQHFSLAQITNAFAALRNAGNSPYVPPGRYLCATRYVPCGYRVANAEEITARRIAQELKIPTPNAIQIAAPAMAALIVGPCWLIPVPASDTRISANLVLARAVAEFVTTARVICAVARSWPVESAYRRRLRGLSGLTVEEHSQGLDPSSYSAFVMRSHLLIQPLASNICALKDLYLAAFSRISRESV